MKQSALFDDVSRRPHERSDGDVCRSVLNISKEDVMKMLLSMISGTWHMDFVLTPPEDVF